MRFEHGLEKQSFLKKEEVIEIQQRVISVLCSIGGNDVVDVLRRVIFRRNILGRLKFSDKIRLQAVEGLAKFDTDSSRIILSRAKGLKNDVVGERATEIVEREKLL